MELIVTTEPQLKQLIVEALSNALSNSSWNNSVKKELKYLTTEEFAELIKTTPAAIRQMVYRKELPSIKRGNRRLFLEDDIHDLLENKRTLKPLDDPANYLKTNRMK